MILVLHVLIAVSSLVWTTYLFFSPGRAKLNVSYGLVVATLASGTYLVASSGAHMLQACATGLLYVGLVSLGIASARSRLAAD